MKISYDYTELLEEFKEEIKEGRLGLEDYVQVLRKEIPPLNVVIDWYYDDERMQTLFDDEYDGSEDYYKDKDKLEKILVGDLIEEMVEVNRIV